MNINNRSNRINHQKAERSTPFESTADTSISGIEPSVSGSHTSLRNEESRDIRNHRSDETFMQKIGESTCDQDKKLGSDGDSSTSDAVSTVEDPLRDGEESSLEYTTFKSYSLEKRSNPEIAYAAVTSDPGNIRYVPGGIQDRERIVTTALQQNGYFLKYLTDEEKSNKSLVSLSLQQFYDASIDDDSIDDIASFTSPLHDADSSLHTDSELFHQLIWSDSFKYIPALFSGLKGYTLDMVVKALDELSAEVLCSLSDERKLDNKVIDWFVKKYESNTHYITGFLSLMPNEFIDNVDNIKKMLERDGDILYELPDKYKNDLKMVDLAVKGGANRALYTLQTNIKQDVNNIIKYGVFDVEPDKINKLKDGLNYELEELMEAVGSSESSALPIPIAAKLMSEVIEPLVLVEVRNKHQGAGQFLEETMNALPLSKRLALGVLFSKNESVNSVTIGAQAGVEIKVASAELEKVAESLYRDERSFVHVPNFESYIDHMSAWLERFNVRIFRINALFSADHCAPLFESSSKNSVLYITESELKFFGSSLNGLLESNEWEVGDTVDQIKARIVVVGDQAGLTPDVRSRLCRHMDAASVKLASLPKEKVKPEQQPGYNSLVQIAKITIESDVESLLNEHYLTAREYANAHNGNKTLEVIDRPLLVASLEELTTLQQHFKIKLPRAFMPAQFITVDQKALQSRYDPDAIILMDSVSDLDELLDFYLMRNKKDGLDASAQLKESPILLNCQNSAALFSKVFSDKSGQAYLEYRGEHYPVKSISLAKIDYDEKETRVDVGKRLSLSDSLNQMKKYYESGELDVSTPIANAIFGYLSRFLGDENPVLVLEGLAGIGKDALTKHYCTELKNLFHDTVFYKHVTAGFDISLVDEALRMRRNYPDKSLIIHVSEGNLASYRQWCDLLTLIRADKNIKIISTQNPSEFGGRFELSHLFISKQSVKKLDFSEYISTPNKTYEHSLSLVQKNRLDGYHRDHFDDCELKPTNRQAAVLRRLLSDVKAESGSVIYEAVYRAYGLYLDGQEAMGLWNIVSGGIPLEYVESTPISDVEGSSEWGATLVGGSTLTRSSCDFSDVASDPKPVWMGHNSAYLKNNGQAKIILQGERSTVIDEKHLDFISADIPPNCAIEVMALPNTQVIGVAVQVQGEGSSDSAYWFLIPEKNEGMFERIDDKNTLFTNTTNVILKLGTFNNKQPKFYSKGGQDIKIEKSSNLLCEQDEIDFVRELIYQKNMKPNGSSDDAGASSGSFFLDEERKQLASIFDIDDVNDEREVVHKIFHYFNTYIDKPFDRKPMMSQALSQAYEHLVHSFISKCGVCRHQAIIMQILLKAFGIKAEFNVNHTHAFVTLQDNTILDVRYFDSSIKHKQYNLLGESVNEAILLSKQHQSTDQSTDQLANHDSGFFLDNMGPIDSSILGLDLTIFKAQKYLNNPHETSSEELVKMRAEIKTKITEIKNPSEMVQRSRAIPSLVGTASSLLQNNCMQESITQKSIAKTASTHNIKMQSNKRKRVQERISCDNVVNLLLEGKISKKEVREQLYALQAPIDYKKWISAIQASECTRAEEPMPPPTKRVRLFDRVADNQYGGQQSKQQSNPSLSTSFSKIEREAATQKAIQKAKDEALGAVVVRMLEDIPKKNSVIKTFIPKSGSDYLRSRARDVGDGYIVSIVRPVTDHSTQILVTLPEKYQDDFVLLGNEGPIMVDSEEAYNHVKEKYSNLEWTKDEASLISNFINRCIDYPLLNGSMKPR